MKINEILDVTNHRPWKIPSTSWKFYQEWNQVIFLHWPVSYDELKEFVPDGLEIDMFEQQPWISLVAFKMERIRPRYLPSLKPISNFFEINLRTYVRVNNKTGVYFLSIEGGNELSCKLAKSISGLPYRYSEMVRADDSFKSKNMEFDDTFEIRFETGNPIVEKSNLDTWLTERYALFQEEEDNNINEFEIHHMEWPLQSLSVNKMVIDYSRYHDLLGQRPKKVHYSNGVQVVAWGKNRVVHQ